jgi:hypothetical protein
MIYMSSIQEMLRGAAAIVLLAAGVGIFAPPAFAYRVVIYWQGWNAGTMEILNNSNPPMQIPEGACGFRLRKPGAGSDPSLNWDDAWYFAEGSLLGSPLDGYTSDDWNEPEYIQATGPVHASCNTNNYLFHTPPTATTSLLAPQTAGAFVAEFFLDNHIEWLDHAGDVIVPEDLPPPGGGGGGEGGCDWCQIPPSLVYCFRDWDGNWNCQDDDDHDGLVLDILTVLRHYSGATLPDLSRALALLERRDTLAAEDSIRAAILRIDHARQVLRPLRDNVIRLEYGTYVRSRKMATRSMMREAAGAIGASQVRFDGCASALARGLKAVGQGGGAAEILAAQNACSSASVAARLAADSVLELRAGGLPGELSGSSR